MGRSILVASFKHFQTQFVGSGCYVRLRKSIQMNVHDSVRVVPQASQKRMHLSGIDRNS